MWKLKDGFFVSDVTFTKVYIAYVLWWIVRWYCSKLEILFLDFAFTNLICIQKQIAIHIHKNYVCVCMRKKLLRTIMGLSFLVNFHRIQNKTTCRLILDPLENCECNRIMSNITRNGIPFLWIPFFYWYIRFRNVNINSFVRRLICMIIK